MARVYRKKPVVIEAVQWTGENHAEMCDFIDPEVFEIIPRVGLVIHTLEGDHHASPGDYIIKGVNGEFYPCKPDIFAKTYESATLTPPNEPRAGLYGKYTVYKNKDGSLVTDCFILRPAKDQAAVAALRAYAAATDNAELSADIINWVGAEPNEPLSIEQLREMDGEPVYVVFLPDIDGEKLQFWALVAVDEWNDVYLANKEGWAFNYEKFLEDVEGIYRRPRDRRTHELRHIPDRPRQPRADRA